MSQPPPRPAGHDVLPTTPPLAVAESAVGVLDKAVAVMLAVRAGRSTVAEVADAAGLARPTAHRLVAALEIHGLLSRTGSGGLAIGALVRQLAADSVEEAMVTWAGPFLTALRDSTGETAQLFRAHGQVRVCVAAAQGVAWLRDAVGVGDVLAMSGGSAAQVLCAWQQPGGDLPPGCRFTVDDLARVRQRGWAESVGQREAGLASVSAPVWWGSRVLGAVCVAGPEQRLGPHPGDTLAPVVMQAAAGLTERLAVVTGTRAQPR